MICPTALWRNDSNLLVANQALEPQHLKLFFRLLRFYKTFIVLSALVGSLSLNILSYNEFHPTVSARTRVAEGFLVSSLSTSVISGMLATMLRFRFEDQDSATVKEYALAWTPLIVLDWSIVSFLIGLLLWYGDKSNVWRTALVGLQTAALLAFSCGVAIWMWASMRPGQGFAKEEAHVSHRILTRSRSARGVLDFITLIDLILRVFRGSRRIISKKKSLRPEPCGPSLSLNLVLSAHSVFAA